jgi:hypothetical protein
MNKIYLYQYHDDGMMFSFPQLDEIKKITNNFSDAKFFLDGVEYERIMGDPTDRELETDGWHVFRTKEFSNQFEDMEKVIRKYVNTDVNIILIGGNLEQNIFSNRGETEQEIFDLINNSTNIRLLHNTPHYNTPNCSFEPKIYFHQYLNLQTDTIGNGITTFYYHRNTYKRLPKDRRLGIHIGTLGDRLADRYKLIKELLANDYCNHKDLYLTLNYSHTPLTHQKLLDETGYPLEKYLKFDTYEKERMESLKFVEHYVPPNYYLGLAMLFLQSDIEIVYETNGRENDLLFKKPTEKLLKMIILGKPFINMDPVLYHVIKMYGFETYEGLMGEELTELYRTYSVGSKICDSDRVTWIPALTKRICELLDMDRVSYQVLLKSALVIAQRNIERFETIYRERVLSTRIKELGWLE